MAITLTHSIDSNVTHDADTVDLAVAMAAQKHQPVAKTTVWPKMAIIYTSLPNGAGIRPNIYTITRS